MHFNPKKHLKFLKRQIFIWEKGTFFFELLFPVVARTWLGLKSDSLFLGPKFRCLVQKSKIREDHRFFLGPVCSALQCQKSRLLYSIMYAGIHALQVQIIRGLIKSNMIKKYIFLNHIRPDKIRPQETMLPRDQFPTQTFAHFTLGPSLPNISRKFLGRISIHLI